MTRWKLPPLAKVYEALSAVADGRVQMSGPTSALVTSSAGDKTYTVRWTSDLTQVTADDNASRWQGYTGYPIIAVLLTLKKLDYDPTIAQALAGVPWNTLNAQYKRDYGAAIDYVLREVAAAGGQPDPIRQEAERIFAQLSELELNKLVGGQKV
jgi:hypothetical protein